MNKKILLLCAAAGTCMLAGAANTDAPKSVSLSKTMTKVAKAADERTWKTLGEGEYSDAVLSNLFRNLNNDPCTVIVEECEQTPGVYRVVNPWPTAIVADVLLYLEIDARDPEMVHIPEHTSPINDPVEGEVHFRSISDYAVNGLGLTKEGFLDGPLGNCNATMADGIITFPKNFLAVMWPDCDPFTGPAEPGVWTISNGEYPGYLVLPGAEKEEEWVSLGTGRMVDGFLWPVFEDASAVPEEKDVEILESKATPGVYKLVKPFLDVSPNSRDLIIDATDPDFVIVTEQNTGVKSKDLGYTYVVSLSATGYGSYDEMVADDPSYADRNITLKDGIFNIPRHSIVLSFPETSNSIYVHEYVKDCYIMLPEAVGIKTVDTDLTNAPATYYNLQGMPLSHPAPGQIVIVRQGDKTYKTIAK